MYIQLRLYISYHKYNERVFNYWSDVYLYIDKIHFVCLFDLILYVPSTIFQLNRDWSSWVEPVLNLDKCVLLKDHNAVTPVRLKPAAPVSSQALYYWATALPKIVCTSIMIIGGLLAFKK